MDKGAFMDNEQPDELAELRPKPKAEPCRIPFLVSPDLREFSGDLRTEPLTAREWAPFFSGCSPKTMLGILREMSRQNRAWQCGSRWEIRLVQAPPRYLIAVGLLQPVVTPKLAIELIDLLEMRRSGKN
jgi:hypothetical protein